MSIGGGGPTTAQCMTKQHEDCREPYCACYCHIQQAAREQSQPIRSDACRDSRHVHCRVPDCKCSCHGAIQIEAELNPSPPVDPTPHDAVNHPAHYTSHPSGVEVIEITRWMNYDRGNAIKYILRAGLKPEADEIEDLEKARWYLTDEIARVRLIQAASSTPTPEIEI